MSALAFIAELNKQLSEPDITCPRCRGKGETYSAYREHVCFLCDGVGRVAADWKQRRATEE